MAIIRIKREHVQEVRERRLEKSIKACNYANALVEERKRTLKQEHYQNKGVNL